MVDFVLGSGLEGGPINHLEAFKMWLFRRMLRISCVEKVAKSKVLRRENLDQARLMKRKISYLDYIF